MATIKQLLLTAQTLLQASDTPEREAILLLAHALQVTPTWLRTWPDKEIAEDKATLFQQYCARRAQGEPVAYIIGAWEFWSLPLQVNKATLIPRPETEHLIEWVLTTLPQDAVFRVADLGTGSGAIALALASERPHWHMLATDISLPALAQAQSNAQHLQLHNIEWRQGSWFEPLQGEQFHLIISNPPYIAADDPHLQHDGLPYEPQTALVAAQQGYADLQHLITHARSYLLPQAWLIVEHGYTQGATVRQLMQQAGFQAVETNRDLAGHERYTVGQNFC